MSSPFRFSRPPAAISRFIGRNRELEGVTALIRTNRLVTLTGAGGSGKTRLAVQAVHAVAERWESIVWIDLAALQDGSGLNNHVAAGFGITEREPGAALDGIRGAVTQARTLLVLDNCEHVIDAAAQLVDGLLRHLPDLTILATSREVLGVEGETAWLVPPLGMIEASELFVERAKAVLPAFGLTPANQDLVSGICRRLDGMPLAIELAAARVKVLSLDQINTRLSDALKLLSGGSRVAVPRHRTLRATIEWSHGLLAESEKVLLRRLAVFPASFTLDAAEVVGAGADIASSDVLDTLSGLVDKSLVLLEATETDARYRLLEIVRQFAAERLAETGEGAATIRRHVEHYLAVAEHAAPHIDGGSSRPLLMAALIPDIPNFRAAVEWASESPDRYEIGLRLVSALTWFWWARGSFAEVRRLEQALDPQHGVSADIRLNGHAAFVILGNWQGRAAEAVVIANRGVELAEQVGNQRWLAELLVMRSFARALSGDIDGALVDADRGIPMAFQHVPTIIGGIGLHGRALCWLAKGDLDRALLDHIEEEAFARKIKHQSGMIHGLSGRANIYFHQGRFEEAHQLHRESMVLAVEVLDNWGIAKGLEGVALCTLDQTPRRAARLLAAAAALRERGANPHYPDEKARFDPAVARLKAQLGVDFDALWKAGSGLPLSDAIGEALSTDSLSTEPARPTPAAAPQLVAVESTARQVDLDVRTLGRFDARKLGQPIESSAWGSARPRELLVYLLCHPNGVTKDQVGAALWPDATPTQVRNNFHVTMHRLRKTLDQADWVQVTDDRYRMAPAVNVMFDAAQFELAVPVERGRLARGEPGAADALASVLASYRGPFMEGESTGDWALDWRDRLARLYGEGAISLGGWYLAQGKHDQALALGRSVVAWESINEAGWRLVMTGLARTNHRAEALKAFQQCQALLNADLDVDPDQETIDLRDRIQRGEPV